MDDGHSVYPTCPWGGCRNVDPGLEAEKDHHDDHHDDFHASSPCLCGLMVKTPPSIELSIRCRLIIAN